MSIKEKAEQAVIALDGVNADPKTWNGTISKTLIGYDVSEVGLRTAAAASPTSHCPPLEVQYNHTIWMPASINTQFGHQGGSPFNLNCKFNPNDPKHKVCKNFTRPASEHDRRRANAAAAGLH